MGFADAPTPTLRVIRANLLRGLDEVNAHIEAGTFETVGAKGKSPPSQSGHLTLWLLNAIDDELHRRAGDLTR